MGKLLDFLLDKEQQYSPNGLPEIKMDKIVEWVKEYNDLVYGIAIFSRIENSGIEFFYTGLEIGKGKNVYYYVFNGVPCEFKQIDPDNAEIYASMEIRMKYGILLNPNNIVFKHDGTK